VKRRGLVGKILTSAIMIPIACGAALPFYYIIVNTFKTQEQTALSPLGLPSSLNFSNYRSVFDNVPVWHSFANTLYVTALAVVAMLLIGSMAAYTFTVRKTRFNKRLTRSSSSPWPCLFNQRWCRSTR